jgi:hypothetical protein
MTCELRRFACSPHDVAPGAATTLELAKRPRPIPHYHYI